MKSPRSRSRIRLPVGASACASVPPPAPVPMMITSKWLLVDMGLFSCSKSKSKSDGYRSGNEAFPTCCRSRFRLRFRWGRLHLWRKRGRAEVYAEAVTPDGGGAILLQVQIG